MSIMKVDQRLVEAALDQIKRRFPSGSGGAAAVYLEDGQILTSVAFDCPNEVANLCHETGAFCEANRLNLRVLASVCVSRAGPSEPFIILTPCGVCQERLSLWGADVQVAIPHPDNASKWQSKTLNEVQPYYWRNVVPNDDT